VVGQGGLGVGGDGVLRLTAADVLGSQGVFDKIRMTFKPS
jgi:hypothetical protein